MIKDYFTQSRPEMMRFLPTQPARVLEIGCGAGGFSGKLRDRGLEVWGVEPNREAAAIAATRLTRVLVGLFDEVSDQLPDGHFDLVVCNDVIEHMPDHDRFLKVIQGKMTRDGRIVGSLPNMRFMTALVRLLLLKDWAYTDEGILDRTHLRFFTQRSIDRALRMNGFDVERLEGTASAVRHGFLKQGRLADLAGRIACVTVIAITFGWYADVQYPQFGFRARRAGPGRGAFAAPAS